MHHSSVPMIPSRSPPRAAGEKESQGGYKARHLVTIVTTNLSSAPVATKYQASSQKVEHLEAHLQRLGGAVLLNTVMQQKQHLLLEVTSSTGEINWPV